LSEIHPIVVVAQGADKVAGEAPLELFPVVDGVMLKRFQPCEEVLAPCKKGKKMQLMSLLPPTLAMDISL
jgi:hypothetical protein